jgi:hypothetical protein
MIKPLSAFQYRLLGTAIAVVVMRQRGMTIGSFVHGHHAHGPKIAAGRLLSGREAARTLRDSGFRAQQAPFPHAPD